MNYYIYRIDILDGSGRFYIGQRTSVKEPWEDTAYKGSGTRLKNLYRRHGGYKVVQDGEFYLKTILQECSNQDELNQAEEHWIGDWYKTNPRCLNLRAGGMQVGFSDKARQKMSKAKLGKKHSEECKKQISESLKRKVRTEEHCKHISESKLNHSVSEETRKKISNTLKGHTPHNVGKIRVKDPITGKAKYIKKEA